MNFSKKGINNRFYMLLNIRTEKKRKKASTTKHIRQRKEMIKTTFCFFLDKYHVSQENAQTHTQVRTFTFNVSRKIHQERCRKKNILTHIYDLDTTKLKIYGRRQKNNFFLRENFEDLTDHLVRTYVNRINSLKELVEKKNIERQ